jgi:hypothetical protein
VSLDFKAIDLTTFPDIRVVDLQLDATGAIVSG